MQIDLEDILANTFARIVFHCLLFLSAVWSGSIVGGAALVIGANVLSPADVVGEFLRVWMSPVLLFSVWLLPNLAVLLFGIAYFVIAERVGFLAWGVMVGFESLFVLLGWFRDLDDLLQMAAAWIAWLGILIMLSAGLWLWRQILTNRWARQLAALHAENAHRLAEREAVERERILREDVR